MKKWNVLLAGLLLAAVLPTPAFAAEGIAEPLPVQQAGGLAAPGGGEDGPSITRPVLETDKHIVFMQGSGDLVRPFTPMTRGEAAQLVYSLLREPPPADEGESFPDVPAGAWYKTAVDSLAATGLLGGYPDGRFGPEDPITRAQLAAIFARCFEPREASLPFTDVEGHWAYEQLATAVAYGWVNGYPDGTMRPDAPITRAEAAAMANRVLGRKADLSALQAQGMPMRFPDIPGSHWAYPDIMEASTPHEHGDGEEGEVWASFTVPTAQRGVGCHSIGGELYCVGPDGYYVRNAAVGYLQFDSNGRYVTGNSRLDAMLTQVVLENTVAGAPPQENLRRLYDYVMNSFRYRANTFVPDGGTGWEMQRAYNMLQSHRGNCFDYAAAFTMLARKLGFQAAGRSGWIRTASWSWDEHGWTEISLDGRAYLCDPEFQGVYVRNHYLGWDLFMKPYGSTPSRYRVAGAVLG